MPARPAWALWTVPTQELQAKLALKAAQLKGQLQKQAAAAKSEGGGGLFNLQALMHTVLGNLQLRLTNVHIRCVAAHGLQTEAFQGHVSMGGDSVDAHTHGLVLCYLSIHVSASELSLCIGATKVGYACCVPTSHEPTPFSRTVTRTGCRCRASCWRRASPWSVCRHTR